MIFKKLAEIANKLDELGFFKEADLIDDLLKNADFFDLFKKPECKCECSLCKEVRQKLKDSGGLGRVAIEKEHCGQNNCPYKKK